MESREVERLISAIEKAVARNAGNNTTTINSDGNKENTKKTNLLGTSMKVAADSTRVLSDLLSGDVRRSFRGLGDATNAISKNFGFLGKTVLGFTAVAGVLHQVFDVAQDMTKSFRSLSDVGQTFGGSMFAMAESAGKANLSMEEFADFISKNSKVVSILGTKSFSDLGNQVRQNIKEFGMFGLTTHDVNDIIGDYTESLRMMGTLQAFTTTQAANATKDLIQETSALSYLTGKSRKDIIKDTTAAMKDSSLYLYMAGKSAEEQQKLTVNLQKATAELAAQPGEVGASLSKMLSQTIAFTNSGGAAMTEFGKNMASIAPAIIPAMDEYAAKVKAGTATQDDQNKLLEQFKNAVPIDTLRALSASGNATAVQFASLLQNIKLTTAEERERARIDKLAAEAKAKDSKAFTDFMLNFEDNYKRVLGGFTEGFMTAFMQFNQGSASIPWDKIRDGTISVGTWLGNLASDIGKTIQFIGDSLSWLGGIIVSVKDWFLSFEAVKIIVNGIGDAFSYLGTNISKGSDMFTNLTSQSGALATIIGGVLTVAIGKWILGLTKTPNKDFNVTNAIINVANQSNRLGNNSGLSNSSKDSKGPKNTNKSSSKLNLPGKLGLLTGALASVGAVSDVVSDLTNKNTDNSRTMLDTALSVSSTAASLLNTKAAIIGAATDAASLGVNAAMDSVGVSTGKNTASQVLKYGGEYAATGALAGSIVPGLGTTAGALIGGGLGAARGAYEANKEDVNNIASSIWDKFKKLYNINQTDASSNIVEANKLAAYKSASSKLINTNNDVETQRLNTLLEKQNSNFEKQNDIIIAQNQKIIELTESMVKSTSNLDRNTREQI